MTLFFFKFKTLTLLIFLILFFSFIKVLFPNLSSPAVSATNQTLPLIDRLYSGYLEEVHSATFIQQISQNYSPGTLEQITATGSRISRRAAVLALMKRRPPCSCEKRSSHTRKHALKQPCSNVRRMCQTRRPTQLKPWTCSEPKKRVWIG